jgi:uncharacterized protein with ParB-like and HNH nuclease domain
MNKFIRFISGKEYCLKDLFGNDTKIVIPDLQRDYCWGDSAYTGKDNKPQELVSGFLKNIIELYKTNAESPITLGLVYGYEQPYNHIQICDGQQRLTTLFLLLGVINTKCNYVFKDYIISEQEREDDNEPHLLYAIRESTLYFLSDLSLHLFIEKKDLKTKEIKNEIKTSNWYFHEYDQDASIQSMISAVETIFNILDSESDIDYQKLGEYILNNLRVLYYDMGNRSRGEETYIVINTTGEPLSATENIKPILLGNPELSEKKREEYSNQWEDREEWFWQHRETDKTSDKGMHTFFTWYWQIGLKQEYRWEGDKKYPLNIKDLFVSVPKRLTENANETNINLSDYKEFKSLDNLNKYFDALKLLVETIATNEQIQKVLSTLGFKGDVTALDNETNVWTCLRSADLDIILPLLCFVKKYGNSNLYSFVRRIRKNHFDKVWDKDDNNQPSRKVKNYVDWRYIIQIINQCESSNILSADIDTLNISKIQNIPLNHWYTENEIWKDEHSVELENIEKMGDHALLRGDFTALRKSFDGSEYDLPTIIKRWNNLQLIYNTFNKSLATANKELSNWFRLYCVVTKITPIKHINYCNWEFEGCFFSSRREMPWWIETQSIDKLLCSNNLLIDIKNEVKDRVKNYIRCPQNHKELIISWLTLKTIKAAKDGKLLNHRNDRAISAYFEMDRNYIIPCNDFHWGNVLCGYSWSYTIKPAQDKDNWENSSKLNSPLSLLPFIPNFCNRNPQCISNENIEVYDKEIKNLIDSFFDDNIKD